MTNPESTGTSISRNVYRNIIQIIIKAVGVLRTDVMRRTRTARQHKATFEFNKSVSSGEYQFSVSIQSGESAEMRIQLGPNGLPPSNRVVVKINPSSSLSLKLSHL